MTTANDLPVPASEGFPPPALPLRRATPAQYRAPARLSLAVQACLVGCVAVATVVAVSAIYDLRLLARFERSPGSVTIWDVEAMRDRSRVIAAIWPLLLLVTGALFIAWTSRLYRNLTALWITDLRFADGWAIGAWFVPFLNLVRPKQIVDDIWRATGSGGRTDYWRNQKVPAALNLWWAAWLIALFLGAGVPSREGALADMRGQLGREVGGSAMFAVAAILAVHVVRRLSRGQQLFAEHRLSGVGSSAGSAEGGRPRPIVRTLLAAGLGTGTLLVAIYAVGHVYSVTTPDDNVSATSPAATDVPVTRTPPEDLRVGDCFDLPPAVVESSDDDPVEVHVVDSISCDSPHDAEVIAMASHPAGTGAVFPGNEALIAFGVTACVERFDEAVGAPFLESDLDIRVLTPVPRAWSLGDRSIECVALRVDGAKLDRTVLGAGI